MNFELTDEQRMLREAAAEALSRLDTVTSAREALDGGPLIDQWPTAIEAGWTGLLVPEEQGGAGLGAFDAMLVAEECGKRLAGAGIYGHLGATLLLSRAAGAGDERAAELLEPLARGECRTAIAFATEGRAEFQLDLDGADLLVAVEREDGTAAIVDPRAAGVDVEPVTSYDPSRPVGHLQLDGAPSEPIAADEAAVEEAWYLAQALLGADALGVSQAMLDMSVAYSKDRYAFGRQIGSFQAIKQQIVEILRHAEAARNLCYFAGFAAGSDRDELALAASAARFAGEQAADYATRTCIAVHGGIGATWEHDAPLYWRRSQLSRLLLGGIAGAGDRVAEEIIERARREATAATT